MAQNFFFYDLETSGVSPKNSRIMQFAGQRTDMDLNPIDEPFNLLVKITEDILPEPDAILITGITPQKTLQEGITEAEFLKIFNEEICTPDTIFVGFNNIRFDDEFIRYTLYRNFYDPYEWQWKDNRSRWDILDLSRVTRALRPDGMQWPFASDGKPSNRLELLTLVNNLDHVGAHDALVDVNATISVAKLIKEKQPKLFDFSLEFRDKKKVEQLVNNNQPLIYVSGKYSSEYEKLAVVWPACAHPNKPGSLVYDLRFNPSDYVNLSVKDLVESWVWLAESDEPRLPVKTLQYNKCPAVAPMSVLSPDDKKRLKIDDETIAKHIEIIKNYPDFAEKLSKACQAIEKERLQTFLVGDENNVDNQLYDSFLTDFDKKLFPEIRSQAPENLPNFSTKLKDPRLQALIPLYKARNFPKSLSSEEMLEWEKFKSIKLQKALPRFSERLQAIASQSGITPEKQYLLEEIQLYAQSIMPSDL